MSARLTLQVALGKGFNIPRESRGIYGTKAEEDQTTGDLSSQTRFPSRPLLETSPSDDLSTQPSPLAKQAKSAWEGIRRQSDRAAIVTRTDSNLDTVDNESFSSPGYQADPTWTNSGSNEEDAKTTNWQTLSDANQNRQGGTLATSGQNSSITNSQTVGLIIPRTREDLERAKLKTNQYGDVITEVSEQ